MPTSARRLVRAFRASACISMQGEKSACASALFSPLRVLDDCLVVAAQGRIVFLGSYSPRAVPAGADLIDLGDVILTPPVVNAHTHVQLSHMAQRTCRGQGFVPWLRSLIALLPLPLNENAIRHAVHSMAASGTGHFADYTHLGMHCVAHAAREEGVEAHLLAEWFGFSDTFSDAAYLPPRCRAAQEYLASEQYAQIIPCVHALYSTAASTVQDVQRWCTQRNKPFVLHLAESLDEHEALVDGSGALVDLYKNVVLPQDWQAPHMSPVHYAHKLGVLQENTLAIHCVHTARDEQKILAEQAVSVCLCPRSNAYIGVGAAPVSAYIHLPLCLCLGTDGLSSNDDLDVWQEARFLHEHHAIPWRALIRMLTVNGVKALHLHHDDMYAGTLCVGARAQWAVFPFDKTAF